MNRLEDFDDALRRPLDELRARLRDGDGPERVWAAWCIGMRSGGGVPAELRGAGLGDPDPGVRRHFAVMLAGAGEWDALLEVARHDPDDNVRGSAARFVARLAAGRPASAEALRELLERSACPEVALALVQELPEPFAAGLADLVARYMDSRDTATRRALAPWLVDHRHHLSRVPPGMTRALEAEEAAAVRWQLAELWLSTESAEEVLSQAALLCDAALGSVLGAAVARGLRFPARVLHPFHDRSHEIEEYLEVLFAPGED